MKVVWTQQAISQVKRYAKIIEEDKPNAAKNWIREIFAREKDISQFPLMGRVVKEFKVSNVREVLQGNHRIIYRIHKSGIDVITVIHGSKKF